jgi:hypothetical protein
MTWILTSAVIAALSAAGLELFNDAESREPLDDASPEWPAMSDSELDALFQEFCSADDQVLREPNPA